MAQDAPEASGGTKLLDAIEAMLLSAAEKNDGVLTRESIHETLSVFRHDRAAEAGKRYRAKPGEGPQNAFEDILFHRFSHLAPKKGGRPLEDGALSLRVLPGFFTIVRMMVGAEKYDTFVQAAAAVEQRLADSEEQLDAESFRHALVQDGEARRIALMVYTRMAIWFAKYKRRKDWFISIINENLPPVRPISTEDPDWTFNEGHFTELFTVLFIEDVVMAILREETRQLIADEFGSEAIQLLESMMMSLNTDIDTHFFGDA